MPFLGSEIPEDELRRQLRSEDLRVVQSYRYIVSDQGHVPNQSTRTGEAQADSTAKRVKEIVSYDSSLLYIRVFVIYIESPLFEDIIKQSRVTRPCCCQESLIWSWTLA